MRSKSEYSFVNHALPHARSKRSLTHTRKLKSDPLISTAIQQPGFVRVKRGYKPLKVENLVQNIEPHQDPTDPYFPYQWYLKNTGQNGGKAKLDLNVEAAWAQGKSAIIEDLRQSIQRLTKQQAGVKESFKSVSASSQTTSTFFKDKEIQTETHRVPSTTDDRTGKSDNYSATTSETQTSVSCLKNTLSAEVYEEVLSDALFVYNMTRIQVPRSTQTEPNGLLNNQSDFFHTSDKLHQPSEPLTKPSESSYPSNIEEIPDLKLNNIQTEQLKSIDTSSSRAPIRSRKRKANTQRQGLAYLEAYDANQGATKKKEMELEEKRLALEERKLAIEERKIALLEKQMSTADNHTRMLIELADKKLTAEIDQRQQLADNAKASFDFSSNDPYPYPRYTDDWFNSHGTRCAGEVAAARDNGICGVGVAYDSKIAALAYLPEETLQDAWLIITENAPNDPLLDKFNDYFVDQWLDNDLFWVIYKEAYRTTNTVEGWHNRLKKRMGKAIPN
ncbi:unnamed protein product [Ceutorhynchus assimilis]|uniref:Uncharacterized protein n=1 Tax=Ceutorhynchus assimilis TaxID=467358 RepID=A0A9N9MIY0_9CUCU|nr:unnamed protein product [Ceutorhynchus assimilis]